MDSTNSSDSNGINGLDRFLGLNRTQHTEINRLTGLNRLLRTQKIFGFGFIPLGRTFYYSYENATYPNFNELNARSPNFPPAAGA
jgi:hypothetical protein